MRSGGGRRPFIKSSRIFQRLCTEQAQEDKFSGPLSTVGACTGHRGLSCILVSSARPAAQATQQSIVVWHTCAHCLMSRTSVGQRWTWNSIVERRTRIHVYWLDLYCVSPEKAFCTGLFEPFNFAMMCFCALEEWFINCQLCHSPHFTK